MTLIGNFYSKNKSIFEKYIYPIILFLYPLTKVNQGIDVSDSTYSLGNYLFFGRMEGMWVISTYLSNVIGFLLVHLPLGNTLLGMNVYTSLFVSLLVLICYITLKKDFSASILFVGEIIAIGFCWIPTGILYNYITYLFFAIGAILLYIGITREKRKDLFFAGFFLGMNVMVRIPNITQAALIVALWYSCIHKKDKIKVVFRKTLCCLFGYIMGFIVPFFFVLLRYGISGFLDMVSSLSSIQSVDKSYSAWSMVTSVILAYARSAKWVIIIIIGIFLGIMMFSIYKGKIEIIKKVLYFSGIAVMLRFFWGRGMFSFRYYEDYTSMFEWGMMGLYLSIITALVVFLKKGYLYKEKIMAVIVLIIIAVTPLGSNNYTCQNLNNLFLVIPFTLYIICSWLNAKNQTIKMHGLLKGCDFPWKSMVIVVILMIIIQSIGFHFNFVFRDGMKGEKRDTMLTQTVTADYMVTNSKNAENLTGLIQYCREHNFTGKEAIFFGDAPGLSFLLEMPFAISTSWPDLDSYATTQFVEELKTLTDKPFVIIRKIQPATQYAAGKNEILNNYIETTHYQKKYENDDYIIFK